MHEIVIAIVEFWNDYRTSLIIHKHAQNYLHDVLNSLCDFQNNVNSIEQQRRCSSFLSTFNVFIF